MIRNSSLIVLHFRFLNAPKLDSFYENLLVFFFENALRLQIQCCWKNVCNFKMDICIKKKFYIIKDIILLNNPEIVLAVLGKKSRCA